MTVARRESWVGTRTLWVQETLAGRLMLGQTIVLLASVRTAGLVASIVGPPIFHGPVSYTHLIPPTRWLSTVGGVSAAGF